MMKRIFTFLLISGFLYPAAIFAGGEIKKPNVAGQFYSANAGELSGDIEQYLKQASQEALAKKAAVLISPHAGYVYSGPVAAYGCKAISAQPFKTVIIVGLSHYHRFEGFAIWPDGRFETPLGAVDIDRDLAQKLMQAGGTIKSIPQAFEKEHSIEVQLPFLQKISKDFKIVPILTGKPDFEDCGQLASALAETIAGRDDILLVVSTDMSHYRSDGEAQAMDRRALGMIKNLEAEEFWEAIFSGQIEVCNFVGVATALLYAKKQGLDKVEILKYANSGDVTGDKSRVVGYSSVVFYSKEGKAMTGQQVTT